MSHYITNRSTIKKKITQDEQSAQLEQRIAEVEFQAYFIIMELQARIEQLEAEIVSIPEGCDAKSSALRLRFIPKNP